MAVPLEQALVLNNEFIERFRDKNYIDDLEVFEYRRLLKHVDKNTIAGASAWAFYHACRREEEVALSFFRKSIPLGDSEFIGNYLIYTRIVGKINEFISATLKIKGQYVHDKSILKQNFHAAFITGDIQQTLYYSQCISNIGNKDEKESNIRFQKNFKGFINENNISDDDFKKITSLVIPFVEDNHLYYESSSAFYDGKQNIFCVIVQSDRIRELNFDFACLVAQCEQFNNKKFFASVIEGDAKMTNNLDISITYVEGVYVAECDPIHLVTESKSLDGIHCNIWDLASDLIELNEVDIDPEKLAFSYHFTQSAKDHMREMNGN